MKTLKSGSWVGQGCGKRRLFWFSLRLSSFVSLHPIPTGVTNVRWPIANPEKNLRPHMADKHPDH
jgi:hypothetical protein